MIERFGHGPFDAKGIFPKNGFSVGTEGASGGGPSFNVYRAGVRLQELPQHAFSRGFTDFQHDIRMVLPGTSSIDTLLERRIEYAKRNGRNVVVMDLGAGDGNFTREFLDKPEVGIKTRRKLSGLQADAQVRLYSVTDSPSAQDHMRKTLFAEAKKLGNEQITGTEVNYSITTSQSIKKLLKGLKESSADVIVAHNFLPYLHPQLFGRVMQDILDVLEPGGQFMAIGYATLAGRYLSIDDGYAPEDKPVIFSGDQLPDEGVTGEAVRSWGQDLLTNDQTTDLQFRAAVDRIQDIMFASDYYSYPPLINFRQRIRHGEGYRKDFAYLLGTVLPLAEDTVRIEEIQNEKDKILQQLRENNSSVASIEYDRVPYEDAWLDAIVLKKRIESSRVRKRSGIK